MVDKAKEKKKGSTLVCQRCKHVWDYTGKAKWYTSCPNCKTTVNVKTRLKDSLDERRSK